MKMWTLQAVVKNFEQVVKGINFNNLPDRNSEEYRHILMKTADEQIFSEGRYSLITEYILEIFDIQQVNELICDLNEINSLSSDQRTRLSFYLDLKDVCYPLFRGKEVDWSAWPWNMSDGSSSMDNSELFDFITESQYPCLSAAIIYDIQNIIWNDEKAYSSVARQEIANIYNNELKGKWEKDGKTEEGRRTLAATVNKVANDYWVVENHMKVGRMLGFDLIAQSVYDALDTFIDTTYRHAQIAFAREFGAWINKHWTIGEQHPEQEKVSALYEKMKELMDKYKVTSPDLRYTWNIITLDVLGMSLYEDEDEDEDENWDEEMI